LNGPFPLSAGLRYAVECRGVRLRGIELGGLGKPSPSQCCQAGAAREVLSGRQSRSAAHRLLRKASISNTRDSCLSWGRDLLVLFRHNPASEYSPEFENLALDRARTCVPTGSSILAAITGHFDLNKKKGCHQEESPYRAYTQCPSTSAALASVSFPDRYCSRAAATVGASVV